MTFCHRARNVKEARSQNLAPLPWFIATRDHQRRSIEDQGKEGRGKSRRSERSNKKVFRRLPARHCKQKRKNSPGGSPIKTGLPGRPQLKPSRKALTPFYGTNRPSHSAGKAPTGVFREGLFLWESLLESIKNFEFLYA